MWWLEEVMPRSLPRRGVAPEAHHQVSPCEQGFQYVAFPLNGMNHCPADSNSSDIVREVRACEHHALSDGEELDNLELENIYETRWIDVQSPKPPSRTPDPRTIPFPQTQWIVQFRNRNSQHSFSYFFYPPTEWLMKRPHAM